MGMAQPIQRGTPKPHYKNTVVCKRCHAEYNPNTKWMWVVYDYGDTSGRYTKVSSAPEAVCPVCLNAPKGT